MHFVWAQDSVSAKALPFALEGLVLAFGCSAGLPAESPAHVRQVEWLHLSHSYQELAFNKSSHYMPDPFERRVAVIISLPEVVVTVASSVALTAAFAGGGGGAAAAAAVVKAVFGGTGAGGGRGGGHGSRSRV